MDKILSGKKVADKILNEVNNDIKNLKSQTITPNLKIILAGDDAGSKYYAKSILKNSKKVGIKAELVEYSDNVNERELLSKIEDFNHNSRVHAIQIMLPLPNHISAEKVSSLLNPEKDVDCLNPLNMGKLVWGKDTFIPNTPAAVMELLKYFKIKTDGKNIVILGRSNIVGKPLANLLIQKNKFANATVTVCHSHTKNLVEHTRKADILIVAIGKPEFVTPKYVSKDSIIIDVGINRILDKDTNQPKYVGDVDYDSVLPQVRAITPVPGGIGSITTAALMVNISKAAQKLISVRK